MDDSGLEALEAVLTRVKAGEVPAAELVAARKALGVGALTIDRRTEGTLGHPLVVLTERPSAGADPAFATLTAREREVAELVAAGLRNADIALALEISVGTVKDHVHRILAKSRLDGRAHIAALW